MPSGREGRSMNAVQFSAHGDRDVIEYGQAPDPDPDTADDEVLVEVKAAALNHLDVWTRRGLPGIDLEMPHIPGSDAAGVVKAVGSRVDRFDPGDHVAVSAGVACGSCEFCRDGDPTRCVSFHIIGEHVPGVHAERVAVPADNLVPVPEDVPWDVAGSVSLVFQTAWRMLQTRAELRQGESILVLGASGGVGHAAVQIADHAGAEVYATASSTEKLDYARDCGADHVCDYTEESLTGWIRERTGTRGVDVVVDHVGAETWTDSLKCLAKGGRLVTCGATTGGRPETDINRIFWNQLEVIGSTMGTPGETDDVLSLVWDGTFEPRVRERLPMSEASRAHELLEEREGFGKVVVVPDSEL
jgi:NADPH:quinone reductase-like Zn-dependent oxidoreductase